MPKARTASGPPDLVATLWRKATRRYPPLPDHERTLLAEQMTALGSHGGYDHAISHHPVNVRIAEAVRKLRTWNVSDLLYYLSGHLDQQAEAQGMTPMIRRDVAEHIRSSLEVVQEQLTRMKPELEILLRAIDPRGTGEAPEAPASQRAMIAAYWLACHACQSVNERPGASAKAVAVKFAAVLCQQIGFPHVTANAIAKLLLSLTRKPRTADRRRQQPPRRQRNLC